MLAFYLQMIRLDTCSLQSPDHGIFSPLWSPYWKLPSCSLMYLLQQWLVAVDLLNPESVPIRRSAVHVNKCSLSTSVSMSPSSNLQHLPFAIQNYISVQIQMIFTLKTKYHKKSQACSFLVQILHFWFSKRWGWTKPHSNKGYLTRQLSIIQIEPSSCRWRDCCARCNCVDSQHKWLLTTWIGTECIILW